jgi:hypothetical protein
MSNDLTKRTSPTKPERQQSTATDPASRLKGELMADAVDRLLGKDVSNGAPDNKPPRVLFAVANHARSPGWDRAKALQRQMFNAAAGSGLQMKFAFWGRDNAAGVRHFRITEHWIADPDEMAGHMDRHECNCGCYVHMRSVLEQAVKENADAVIIVGDAFHDDQDSLDDAARAANQLRRKTLAAVSDTINGKVHARVLDAYLDVWRAVNMTVYKLQECGLINDIDWELFLAARPPR